MVKIKKKEEKINKIKNSLAKKIVKNTFTKIKNKKTKGFLKKRLFKKKKKATGVKLQVTKLERSLRNPIIKPRLYSWESKATFNPSAFSSNGKVHLIYRAVGDDDVSVLGYASTYDGYKIEERPTYHIYKRSEMSFKIGEPLIYSSGGGWSGGCEDPRLTLIGCDVYMLYTAFDGWNSVRIALTSITLDDFKKKKWNWSRPVLISPPGEIHKNWVIFPEKINGKFAILHSFYPKILIDYFDDLDELDGNKFIKSDNTRPVDNTRDWDSWFRGVGPSPIKIKEGWLVLYHAMNHRNPDRYKLGALILDSKNPTKVLYRSDKPILEPEEHYENNGYKWGVVYSCGAIVKEGRLFVYYGGADKVVCVASVKLDQLIEGLKKHKSIKLKKNKLLNSQ
jgi:beta-1,2-mannobiose phosphorylase / 1,2-beta-oligomannan phosphorylase